VSFILTVRSQKGRIGRLKTVLPKWQAAPICCTLKCCCFCLIDAELCGCVILKTFWMNGLRIRAYWKWWPFAFFLFGALWLIAWQGSHLMGNFLMWLEPFHHRLQRFFLSVT
jgi:hypothetical protein